MNNEGKWPRNVVFLKNMKAWGKTGKIWGNNGFLPIYSPEAFFFFVFFREIGKIGKRKKLKGKRL